MLFLSCKANARVKPAKTGHSPHSSTLVCICVVFLLFVLFYVLFVCKCVLPLGDNPIAINKYIISYHIINSSQNFFLSLKIYQTHFRYVYNQYQFFHITYRLICS